MMSDEVSAVQLLFEEFRNDNPDMTKIDEYIIRCCNNKEDINTRFQDMTPLHMACSRGYHEIVKMLLEKSDYFKYPIYINAIGDSYDVTPLHFACRKTCQLTVCTLLLHPNIEVNNVDHHKRTPLHYACLFSTCYNNDKAAVVQLLLEHGTIIDINALDVYGDAPLHDACAGFYFNKTNISIIVNLLKQPSIIFNKKNNNNETPLEICMLRLDNPQYQHQKAYYTQAIQLFEDYPIQQRSNNVGEYIVFS